MCICYDWWDKRFKFWAGFTLLSNITLRIINYHSIMCFVLLKRYLTKTMLPGGQVHGGATCCSWSNSFWFAVRLTDAQWVWLPIWSTTLRHLSKVASGKGAQQWGCGAKAFHHLTIKGDCGINLVTTVCWWSKSFSLSFSLSASPLFFLSFFFPYLPTRFPQKHFPKFVSLNSYLSLYR